ncbi:MAG: DUF4351 domain-containing protein [Magnetococcales bacterium]|nr:DUF4351 domain-containing protein [Magnetococcales bacterium]
MASPTLEENILDILCRMNNQKETILEILLRISELPTKARDDALTKLVILSRLRKLETVVKTEAEEMSLTFNVMENDVLRPLFMKAQMDGEQKGREEEAASMLLKQMRRKFGQTPDWVTEKVQSAKLELIEVWGENVLFANSVDEVFAS